MENKNKKLVTHNGNFHTDDIFAAATLSLVLEKQGESFEIIRTRDEEVINSADFVFDVGGIYDAEKNRFDHHQIGGAGKNSYGIDFSSFGLVWEKFGVDLCGSEDVARLIEKNLVAPIDAHDNGTDLVTFSESNKHEISPYKIQNLVFSMYPTWREKNFDYDKVFLKIVPIAKEILAREITQAKDFISAKELVTSIYKNTTDKRIIVLDESYPEALFQFPEPLFVVYPRKSDNSWGVKALLENLGSFKNKKNLPASWAGLKDGELQKITNVEDAMFCHRSLHLAGAKSKEGAIALAKKALEAN